MFHNEILLMFYEYQEENGIDTKGAYDEAYFNHECHMNIFEFFFWGLFE